MFRELLESNDFKIEVFDHETREIKYWCFDLREGVKYKEDYLIIKDAITHNKDQALEQACLQYCIENGVKKSWLDKWRNDIYGEEVKTYKHDLKSRYCGFACHFDKHNSDNKLEGSTKREKTFYDKELKLIAAIYAHDIKIVAT